MLNKYSKQELRAGQEPVCIYEFIDNEYQEMLEAGYDNYNDFIAGL